MLAIDPGLVRFELATDGPDLSLDELLPRLRADGVRSVSPSGVLGDPEGASGAEGERFINDFVDDLVLTIEQWRPIDPTPHAGGDQRTEVLDERSPVDASNPTHD